MIRHPTPLCITLCLILVSATAPAEDKAPPALGADGLRGKLVRIYHDVDLLGAGKPSRLHTEYLVMVLERAGATVVRQGADGKKKPDVVIFGDTVGPVKRAPGEAADPFLVMKAKRHAEEIEAYKQSRPKLEQDAAAAGARVIRSADVARALGIGVTEAQIVEALDARARDTLKRPLPEVKFDRIGLSEVVDFLRDVSGANIFVNWRALEAAGVDRSTPITLELRDVPMSVALDLLLAQAGVKGAKLGYAVSEGLIMISTEDDVKRGE